MREPLTRVERVPTGYEPVALPTELRGLEIKNPRFREDWYNETR